jgi:hypothetical protein
METGQNNNHFVITMDCGEPDTSGIASQIFIQAPDVTFTIPLPNFASQWEYLCIDDLLPVITNSDLPDYITSSKDQVSVFSS